MGLQNVINGCKELKFLNCACNNGKLLSSIKFCNLSLEEIHIDSRDSDLTDTFVSGISAHGGLVHVVFNINSMTSRGITLLVLNSPNLLTFHIFLKHIKHIFDQEPLPCTPEEYQKRKVFNVGSYKLVMGSYLMEHVYEYNPNLLSLWNYNFWEVVNESSDTDVLTTVDFDTDTYITEEITSTFDEFFD